MNSKCDISVGLQQLQRAAAGFCLQHRVAEFPQGMDTEGSQVIVILDHQHEFPCAIQRGLAFDGVCISTAEPRVARGK